MTIKTKPATSEYRDGYDRIFSKPPEGLELSQANLQKVLEDLPEGESITFRPDNVRITKLLELERWCYAEVEETCGIPKVLE